MQGCRDIFVNDISCRGPLFKRSSSLGVSSWKKRWFVFDRMKKTLVYYSDFKQYKLKGGVPFSSIQEVYFDHLQQHKSPNPNFTFIVKTKLRPFSLVAPTASCMRIWMDAIVTGCEGNDIYISSQMQWCTKRNQKQKKLFGRPSSSIDISFPTKEESNRQTSTKR